jgi:hypothetical protein
MRRESIGLDQVAFSIVALVEELANVQGVRGYAAGMRVRAIRRK